MADQRKLVKHGKRANPVLKSGINSLISAANKNDRFKLLEDSTVLPPNLSNSVHAVFRRLEEVPQLQQALRLASHFLLHDKLLEFFVPLLFGRESIDLHTQKIYLCDPLSCASTSKYTKLLSDVREAFQSLAKRVEICFVQQKDRLYARTLAYDSVDKLTRSCCRAFQQNISPKIEITDTFLTYYCDPNGYNTASLCAQYRHDLHFATTLVHEVVHALGVMRRGNLKEPYYRLDFPETEWGYAWENFMFGSILNPQAKTNFGTHLLMHKVWADSKLADAKGGKEYCDVPMAWTAQWFRNETWDVVAKQGPTGIAPPTTHFKIQTSRKLGAWVVTSDCPDVRKDIADLYKRWQKHCPDLQPEEPPANGRIASHKIYYNNRATAALQAPNVPIPQRLLTREKKSLMVHKTSVSTGKLLACMDNPPNAANLPLIAVCRAISPNNIRKRHRNLHDEDDDDEDLQTLLNTKRLRTGKS